MGMNDKMIEMLRIYIFIFLIPLYDVGNSQEESWIFADEKAEIAYRNKNWNLAIRNARRAIKLYKQNNDTFDASIYVSLVEQLSDFYACEGDGGYAVFVLGDGINEIIDRYGYRNPELLRLYEKQALYYDLMYDFKKVDSRLRARVNLSVRLFDAGSEKRLAVLLERISWLIDRRGASHEELRRLLRSAKNEIRQESQSQRIWLKEYEARLAKYAGDIERAISISKNLLALSSRLGKDSKFLTSVYSRLGSYYFRSGQHNLFLDILSNAAASRDAEIRDRAIISPLPEFSAGAEARGLFAKFTFQVNVDAQGRVQNVSILESNANSELESEFLQAVKSEWRFPPGLDSDGKRVARKIGSIYFEFVAPNNARRFLR